MARNTFATIDVAAIAHNLARVREWAGSARIMAVVKAEAYGHHLRRCLPSLKQADLLAVATMDEARDIRALDGDVPILLLEGVVAPSELAEADALGLEQVVHHPTQLDWIEQVGIPPGRRLWLKLDSGMHRLGFPLARAAELHARLSALPGVEQIVLMTHFANADRPDGAPTRHQIGRFDTAVEGLAGAHCLANSAALINVPESRRNWVRTGLLLYGVSPLAERDGPALGLQAAMTLESRLIAVNHVPAGESIGYGARFTASRDMTIGVAAIGYGDGYPRNMPDGAPVLVNGIEQPLAGRVSMDMITIDLAGQPDATVGDPVVLWGRGLPVERIARAVDTIPYELLCRVTRRVKYRSAD
ncbi:MAG: alanine racemase [Wenzhouxiangellaceae bacterium]|nr:alanine racemase [Wenzhouxiangellaceae bacterium]